MYTHIHTHVHTRYNDDAPEVDRGTVNYFLPPREREKENEMECGVRGGGGGGRGEVKGT